MAIGLHLPDSDLLIAEPDPSGKLQLAAKPAPRRKRDRSAKQQALLEAATKLFAERGYERTTTKEIAAHAGCAEGLIHRYFEGKAGLMLALIEKRVSQEVEDLVDRVPLGATLEEEFVRLVDWELERIWEDRDFLRVIIPRAMIDTDTSKVLGRVSTSRHSQAIKHRLSRLPRVQSLTPEEVDSLARFIGLLGFNFGFMRPVIHGQNRAQARKMAMNIAKIFIRGI
jgi:AcrR family transcriptional regulator